MFDAVWAESEAVQPPLCPSGGAWVGPDVGSTVAWQDTGDNRAPLVASVLEQFGRMTALAKETTSNLLTSTAYWGAQPGQHHLISLHHAVHYTLWRVWIQLFRTTSNPVMLAFCSVYQISSALMLYWQLVGLEGVAPLCDMFSSHSRSAQLDVSAHATSQAARTHTLLAVAVPLATLRKPISHQLL